MFEGILETISRYLSKPPVNVFALARELGIQVLPKVMSDHVSGMLKKSGDDLIIYVNALHPEARQRFTVAHELGHAILHDNLIGDGITDGVAYRANRSVTGNPNITARHETDANRFAASILMPESIVSQLMEKHDGNRTIVAAELGVSEKALSIRLKSVSGWEWAAEI